MPTLPDRTTPTTPAPAAFAAAPSAARPDDAALLPSVVAAVRAASARVVAGFSRDARLGDLEDVVAAIHAGDAASLGVLRPRLVAARPEARWAEDELADGALPPGEWWVTDPVEGAVNRVHGLTDWGVTATLVRDNVPVLTAVHLPLAAGGAGTTYTAVRGGGASQDGVRLHPSAKSALGAALVGTGQAKPGEDRTLHQQVGRSVAAMLDAALVVRVSVPATLQLIEIAAGRLDAFWQFSAVRSGLLAGALLVAEAGGVVTDTHGHPWTLASADFLAAAPGLHAAAVAVLSAVA